MLIQLFSTLVFLNVQYVTVQVSFINGSMWQRWSYHMPSWIHYLSQGHSSRQRGWANHQPGSQRQSILPPGPQLPRIFITSYEVEHQNVVKLKHKLGYIRKDHHMSKNRPPYNINTCLWDTWSEHCSVSLIMEK